MRRFGRILLKAATALSLALATWAIAMHVSGRPKDAVGVEWGEPRPGTQYSLRVVEGDLSLHARSDVRPATTRPAWESVVAVTEWGFDVGGIYLRRDRHRNQDRETALGHALYVRVPLIYVALLAMILPVAHLVRTSRRIWRPRPGRCPACGYDLRATPDRCPECGAAPPPPPAAPPPATHAPHRT